MFAWYVQPTPINPFSGHHVRQNFVRRSAGSITGEKAYRETTRTIHGGKVAAPSPLCNLNSTLFARMIGDSTPAPSFGSGDHNATRWLSTPFGMKAPAKFRKSRKRWISFRLRTLFVLLILGLVGLGSVCVVYLYAFPSRDCSLTRFLRAV